MSQQDVSKATGALARYAKLATLENLRNFRIAHLVDTWYVCSFVGNRGEYGFQFSDPFGPEKEIEIRTTIANASWSVNRMAYSILPSVILNMAKTGDSTIDFLVKSVKAFWDTVFTQVYNTKGLDGRKAEAFVCLDRMFYKNPLGRVEPHSWIPDPVRLKLLVSSGIGNFIYMNLRFDQDTDVTRKLSGSL